LGRHGVLLFLEQGILAVEAVERRHGQNDGEKDEDHQRDDQPLFRIGAFICRHGRTSRFAWTCVAERVVGKGGGTRLPKVLFKSKGCADVVNEFGGANHGRAGDQSGRTACAENCWLAVSRSERTPNHSVVTLERETPSQVFCSKRIKGLDSVEW